MKTHDWVLEKELGHIRCMVCGMRYMIPYNQPISDIFVPVWMITDGCKPEKPGLPEKLSPLSSCRLVRSDVAQDKAIDAIIDYLKAREK